VPSSRPRSRRVGPAGRLVATLLAVLLPMTAGAACRASVEKEPVRISWWVTDYLWLELWKRVAADFMAQRPDIVLEIVDVTVEWNGNPVRSFESAVAGFVSREDYRPDLFEQWGGADLVEEVRRGLVRDITDQVQPQLGELGAFATPWQVGGRTYGLPYRLYLHGIWYDKNLFAQAGLTAPPTLDAFVETARTLRHAGITPMVVAGASSWELARFWLLFVLANCPRAAVVGSVEELSFDHPCLRAAGDDLAAFLATDPFPADVLTMQRDDAAAAFTSGGAAMWWGSQWEWQLIKEAGVDLDRFGWFPLLGPDAVGLGGGNGFACHAQAPPECAEVLAYLLSPEVQALVAEQEAGLPVRPSSHDPVDPTGEPTRAAQQRMSYLLMEPASAYGWEMQEVLNTAVRAVVTGTGTPQGIVDALRSGAEEIRQHCDDAPGADCRHDVRLN
jgi:raffinose/stachyose/melibiose transport system substrate-binding protein